MPLRSATARFSLFTVLSRHFSSAAKLPKLSKIPSIYKKKAIEEAQKALTDYLHTTRSLPFPFAEHISKNSLFSLSDAIAKVQFSPKTFSKSFHKFLRYNPINEFEFFYESIGISYAEINGFLPQKKFFLSEDSQTLDAACALSGFGFPWNKLGELYKGDVSIFSKSPKELSRRLEGFKDFGFDSVAIIGICMVFPRLLGWEPKLGGEINAWFDDLRKLFIDFDLMSSVEGNVDAWIEICRKIRVFYDLGCLKGKMGELMGRSKHIFLEYPEDVLINKVGFFSRLSVNTNDIVLLILKSPEIFDFDLEDPVISVLGLLKHFGMKATQIKSTAQMYPYVLGRNKMANLPHVIRAMDLHEWFFNKIRNGNHHLLGTYTVSDPNEDLDKGYRGALDKIESSTISFKRFHLLGKLNFLHSFGYGENGLTINVLKDLHGTNMQLQERFYALLRTGIEFSKLCRMIRLSPKILNQNTESLEQKVKYLCNDMESTLQFLEVFPAYLCYNLEKRIKPRYRFHLWLDEKGLPSQKYSISSIIATSEKSFLARAFGIHPAAPKVWFECFRNKNLSSNFQEESMLNDRGQDERERQITRGVVSSPG